MTKPLLSIALAVFNEENNLEDCLASVRDIADEIVIVDGGSTDRTVEIAKRFQAKVIQTENPPIFHINKQKAFDACTGEWILHLDADERVSKALAQEIRKIVESDEEEIDNHDVDSKKYALQMKHLALLEKRDGAYGTGEGHFVAFFVDRKNFFLGRYLMHGGAYPDSVIRLFKRGHGQYPCKSVHEQIEIDGRVSFLSNDLIHMADPTFERYLFRSNRAYTTLQANEWFAHHKARKGERPGMSVFSKIKWMILMPLRTFFLIYFQNAGYRDGFAGFVWAMYSGLHLASSYVKYWEMRTSR
jgi:glycosyltransferase involved in cell wall biosynthesis